MGELASAYLSFKSSPPSLSILFPSGWLKKYHKLSIISPSHSKNQEQWINEMWTGTGNEVGMRNAKGQRKRCDGLEREEEQRGLEVEKTCVCLKKF